MQKLWDSLENSGFTGRYDLNGSYVRFDRSGDSNGWFRGRVTPSGLAYATWGDWKTGERYEWSSLDGSNAAISPEQLLEIARAKEQEEKDKREAQAATAEAAEIEWQAAQPPSPNGLHGYLISKRLTSYGPAKLDARGNLLIPMRDTLGKLWNLQRIASNGDKYFMPGGRIDGLYCAIGNPGEITWLCEGYATGLSVATATGHGVAVCFNAGNLPKAASELRTRYPGQRFGVSADNDAYTQKQGQPYNPGLDYAARALKLLGPGAVLAYPVFENPTGKPTDFNDLAALHGPAAVQAALQAAMAKAEATPLRPLATASPGRGLEPLPPVTKNGKLVSQPEQAFANALLEARGPMLSQGEDLFSYTGTHWQILSEDGHKDIKRDLQRLYGGTAANARLESTYKLFCLTVPSVPPGIDMFTPHPMAANFSNGTLWLARRACQGGFEYATEFRPHRQQDYLITCLPYEYKTSYPANPEFDAMLDRIFDGDLERETKKAMLSEMFGACLVPAWPHIWMLLGKPGTGKSTILKIASKFVTPENLSQVDPCMFKGFDMASMVGKLVNMTVDIDTRAVMAESQIKMIVDRVPFRIARKFKSDVYAPIPAVHLFGGNAMPKLPPGTGGAHDRRWTVLEFRKEFAASQGYEKEFHQHVFDAGPGGILAFALAGLDRLCAQKGHFTRSKESEQTVKNWQDEGDYIGQFLKACNKGVAVNGVFVTADANGEMLRSDLWKVFDQWQAENLIGGRSYRHVGKFGFFNDLRKRGFKDRHTAAGDMFQGFRGMPVGAV